MNLVLESLFVFGEPALEIPGERFERHRAEPLQEQRLHLAKRPGKRVVDGLFDQAAGIFRTVAHRDDGGRADRAIDVRERDGGGIARQRPAAAMALLERTRPCSRRPAITRRTTTGLVAIACASCSDVTGSPPDHVEQAMQDAGQAAIADHVTSYVT